MPKLVADARGVLDVLVTVLMLLAAVGLLIAALGTGHAGLAWGSVALSAVAAVMILRRWRRSWLQRQDAPEDEPVLLLEDEPLGAAPGDGDTEPGEQPLRPASAVAVQEPGPATVSAERNAPERTVPEVDAPEQNAPEQNAEPGEEDTDAADLLVVYELADEVLVVDEHPRYHLTRCRWPDHARAERLPVREARELGFTPCDRCRPDKSLARKHRAASATATGSS